MAQEMETLQAQLLEIRSKHGALTPVAVELEARDPAHPLHSRLEWDERAGAYQYRLIQASQLIRSVRIVEPDGRRDLRAFVAVPQQAASRREYMPTTEALTDPITRELVLRDMRRDWEALRRRWAHMSEFAELIEQSMAANLEQSQEVAQAG